VNQSGPNGTPGNGGEIQVSYLDVTGLSTLNITIGSGGAGGATGAQNGFRGEVLLEYVA